MSTCLRGLWPNRCGLHGVGLLLVVRNPESRGKIQSADGRSKLPIIVGFGYLRPSVAAVNCFRRSILSDAHC